MCTDSSVQLGEILRLIDKSERGEAAFAQNSSPLPIDFPSPSLYDNNMTRESLIAELEAKVKQHQERVNHHRDQLRIWERALQSAMEERGEDKPASKKASQVKGKVSRAFVREVLKRNTKTGVTPKQIREAADQQGLTYPGNFPHTTLHKFRTQAKPEVREEDGKYFPILSE
jgi:hypothetical protein